MSSSLTSDLFSSYWKNHSVKLQAISSLQFSETERMFIIDQVQHSCNIECFCFVCLVTGDIVGSLQIGWHYLLGPGL